MTCAIYSKSKPIIFPIYYSLRISITALKSCSPLKCNQMKFFWQTVLHDRGLLCKLKHGGEATTDTESAISICCGQNCAAHLHKDTQNKRTSYFNRSIFAVQYLHFDIAF